MNLWSCVCLSLPPTVRISLSVFLSVVVDGGDSFCNTGLL
jgi:hypothetical protein